jgi:cysteine desulfurase / selenocysteine lyase
VKEKQESELLNNADYGLLNNVDDSQKIKTRKGAPTPDDLDELLVKVWKEPGDLGLSSYSFDVEAIRRDFPILREQVNGRPLIWLDNGATTQKPQSVIDRLSYFYEHENSNVHRAAHELAAARDRCLRVAREKTRRFLNAGAPREIVFVRGATEAINLVAQSWGRQNIQEGRRDRHHLAGASRQHRSLADALRGKGRAAARCPVDDSGQVLLDEYEKLLGPKTRLVSIAHVSNALGTIVPVKEMVEALIATARACWSMARRRSRTCASMCRPSTATSMSSPATRSFAPTGIGVVYGKSEVLDTCLPGRAAAT